jgi:hypothetical protein
MNQQILDALTFYADERSYSSGHNGPDVMRDLGVKAKEALESAEHGWRPIDTAPTDGTEVLILSPSLGLVLCRYSACDEASRDDGFPSSWVTTWSGERLARNPSHWMPVPPKPAKEQQ